MGMGAMSKMGFIVFAGVLLVFGTAFNYSLTDVRGGQVIYGGGRTGSAPSGWHK